MKFEEWAEASGVNLELIQPGRARLLSASIGLTWKRYLICTCSEVREMTSMWRHECNDERRHESLGNLTPSKYMVSKQNMKTPLLRDTEKGSLTNRRYLF